MTHNSISESEFTVILERLRLDAGMTSLSAALLFGDTIQSAAVGERKRGSGIKVTQTDAYLIGSVSKTFTATLAAQLVEAGVLSWEQTLGQCFPAMAMHDAYRNVTLEQMLCHRGGFPHDGPFEQRFAKDQPYQQNREAYLAASLASPPASDRPEHAYSNVGFVAASMLLEQATGRTWSELLEEFIFQPLELMTASVGGYWTQDDASCTQPWPHEKIGYTLSAVGTSTVGLDAPNDYGAGFVRCSAHDLMVFLREHNRGHFGKSALLSAEGFRRLHEDHCPGFEYGLGVGVYERGWAHGKALSHSGSDGFSAVLFWLAPAREFGMCVATNEFRPYTMAVLDDVIGTLFDACGLL